ncbi:MAG: TonB-dependent siderophore receptor [Emcibacter sp.]|nr:TonB-dependent siderophore receptor [Emcibacter sp.]
MTVTPFTASAADEVSDEFSMEEVVVTAAKYVSLGGRSASKSDSPLIETPQSVTVISRDQIDLLSWNSLQESVRYTAGAVGENFGPDERYDWLTLRGFNPVQYIDGLQAPVGSVSNVGTDLYGSETVEILKGPSSVLYGLTPPGGIVNMTSRRPESEFRGEIGAQYGSHDHKQFNGDFTGPLTDNVSFRVTGLFRDRGTQIDFVESERLYLAPAVTVDFSEDTTVTFLAYYQKDDIANASNGFLPAAGTHFDNPLGQIPVSFSTGEPGVNRYNREQFGVGYDFSHDFNENLSVQQNFKYFRADTEQRGTYGQGFVDADFDGVPDDYRTINRATFPFDEVVNSYNFDTRATYNATTGSIEHDILVGFDYRRYEANSAYGFASSTWPVGSVPTLDVFNPVYGVPFTDPAADIPYTDQVQKQAGLYVQDQIRMDKLVLTLSGRHDWVKTDNAGVEVDDKSFSYRAGLNYVFDNGIAPYFQAAKSFQPISGSDFSGNAFTPSTGEQFEVGIKYDGRTLGDNVQFFASAAFYTLKQKNVLINDPDHLFFQIQEGEVTVEGIELELVTRINERISINASYTYTDAFLPAVSKHKASLLVDYTQQTGDLAGLGMGIGVRYISSIFGDASDVIRTPGVTLFDASVHYDTADWRFAVSASNLFDKTYVARCSSMVDCFYGTKRVITGSVTRKF